MAVSATLRTTAVTVAPGGAVRCHVLIRNNSAVVDQFVFTVRGDVVDWTEVRPARVNLMPHQEVAVELTFSPPRTAEVLAGNHPFALQVASREDPAGSVVQEGVLTVEQFVEVEAGIVPVKSVGRRRGRHTVAIDNLGNHRQGVEVLALDPDNRLTFRVKPHAPRLEPGTTTFVRVVARPKKYFWRGVNRLWPFTVQVLVPSDKPSAPVTGQPDEIEAVFEQTALIPRRFARIFAVLLMLLVLLVLLVTTLLRQRPVSIAGPAPVTTTRVSAPPSSVPAPSSVVPVLPSIPPPPVPSGGTGSGGGRASGGNAGGSTSTGPTVSTTFTIRAEAFPAGGTQTFSYVVPPGSRYRVLSAVLRNPAADTGQLEIRHGQRVLGTYELARIGADGVTFRPDPPPLAAPGEVLTLAVTCGNSGDPCTPSGLFTAALVR